MSGKTPSERERALELEKILIKKAGYDYTQQLIDEHEGKEAEIEATEIPEELDAWFEDFISEELQKNQPSRMDRLIQFVRKRAAVLLAALLLSTAMITMNVDAVKVRVMEMVIVVNEQFSSVQMVEREGIIDVDLAELIPSEWSDAYYPTLVPDSFVFDSADQLEGDSTLIRFTGSRNREITFEQFPNGRDFQLDTQGAQTADVEIQGIRAWMVIKGSRTRVLWYNQEYGFLLTADLEPQQTLNIAESVKKR